MDASRRVGGLLHSCHSGGVGERVGDVLAVFHTHHHHRHHQLLCVQPGSGPPALLHGPGLLGHRDCAGLQLAFQFKRVQGRVLPHGAQRLCELLLPGGHELDPLLLCGHGAQVQHIAVQQTVHLSGGHGLHLGRSSDRGVTPGGLRRTGTFGQQQ